MKPNELGNYSREFHNYSQQFTKIQKSATYSREFCEFF